MRDQDLEPKFSWPLAFLVTGVCFLGFFYLLEILNESIPIIFLWIGLAALILSAISAISSLLMKSKPDYRKRRRH